MVPVQIDSTSDIVFATFNAGIGNLVSFWEASQAQKGRQRSCEPLTLVTWIFAVIYAFFEYFRVNEPDFRHFRIDFYHFFYCFYHISRFWVNGIFLEKDFGPPPLNSKGKLRGDTPPNWVRIV